MVIDGVVRALSRELRYDEDGALARRGRVIPGSSTIVSREIHTSRPNRRRRPAARASARRMQRRSFHGVGRTPGATDPDFVATAVSLTARSVAHAYRRFVPEPITEILSPGGGARKNPRRRRARRYTCPPSRSAV